MLMNVMQFVHGVFSKSIWDKHQDIGITPPHAA